MPGATTCSGRGCMHRGARPRYFKSLYLRDPDGHILELATGGPA